MTDKPKSTAEQLQWQLICASPFSEFIEDYADQEESLKDGLSELIQDKSNIPQIMNDILYYISHNESLEKAIENEIKMMQERKERFKRRTENLRSTIKMVFDKYDITKLETPTGTISKVVRKASKVHITDEGALITDFPELYIRQEPKLDKTALKKLLEDGEEIDGAELVDITTIMIRR